MTKEPNMLARISQLHKTEGQWAVLTDFVPMKGEFIIFDPDMQHKYARLKIGDGITKLIDLPFFINDNINDFLENNFNKVLDAGRITDYKN